MARAKKKVYSIAKELDVSTKEILDKLKELGEFVPSPASTIEPPVVRKLEEAFADRKKEKEAAEKVATEKNN